MLHLPEEAALLLRDYELQHVSSWVTWSRNLTVHLSNVCDNFSESKNFLQNVTSYNSQVIVNVNVKDVIFLLLLQIMSVTQTFVRTCKFTF